MCGVFQGGRLLGGDGGLLNPFLRDKKRHTRVCRGNELRNGAFKATLEAPVLFNTRALHAPVPWEGERLSVICYSAGGLLHCTPTWPRQLVDLGFRLPNVL